METRRHVPGPELPGSSSKDTGLTTRKGYETPRLITWGSVSDLTLGGKFGEEDMDFTGTQGT